MCHPHNAQILSDTLINCLMDWNIDCKLSTFTIDNCNTNDAMISIVKDKLSSRELLLDGKLFHMHCCAHILNLIVRDGLFVTDEGIGWICDSVVYCTTTPKRIEKFEETTRQLHIDYTKTILLDCMTRWNSTYLMLSTVFMYKSVFVCLG